MSTPKERSVKQVIVFRKDLLKGQNAIRKGKFAAQCCHASLGAVLSMMEKKASYQTVKDSDECILENTTYQVTFEPNSILDKWLNGIFTKICLCVENEEELIKLYSIIKETNPKIPCVLITDAGLTEFHGQATNTCIGIGPFWSDEIDEFTKELKLL